MTAGPRTVIGTVMALLVLIPNVAFHPGETLLVGSLTMIFMAMVASVWAALYFSRAALYLDANHVGKADFLGRKQVIPRGDLAHIRLCSVQTRWSARPMRAIVMVGRDGRCLMRFNGFYWGVHDIEELSREAGVPMTGDWATMIPAPQLEAEVPGAATRSQMDPNRAEILLFVVLMAVLLVVAAIIGAFGAHSPH